MQIGQQSYKNQQDGLHHWLSCCVPAAVSEERAAEKEYKHKLMTFEALLFCVFYCDINFAYIFIFLIE